MSMPPATPTSWNWWKFLTKVWSGLTLLRAVPNAGVIVLVAVILGIGPFKHLSAFLGSVAQVTVSASGAIDSGIRSVTSASSGTATLFVGALSAGQHLGEELWRGVDIHNMSVTIHQRRVRGDDAESVRGWFDEASDPAVVALSDEELQILLSAAASLELGRPRIEGATQRLAWPDSFRALEFQAFIGASGHVALQWRLKQAHFSIRWSNPFWAIFECDMAVEQGRVFQALNESLHKLPVGFAAWHAPESEPVPAADIPPALTARARRLWRVLTIGCRVTLDFSLSVASFVWRQLFT